eukprot:CAMPEP_0184028354 /NCGR_PEP_ID=MMETSP0954-20121128/14778_1 /TAXON_ID=627963 /ORGANISM="Aplanochytrium sp, Strain PBS07" /LENGTH=358 /DNA_ID=CAMNT_0026313157 /DNA_START=70 /DNA_END=1147 /DNA_ORIENTATION=+
MSNLSFLLLFLLVLSVAKAFTEQCSEDADESGFKTFEKLKQWIEEGDGNGFIASQVELKFLGSPYNTRGIVSTEVLPKGIVVARIPFSKLINVEHAFASKLNKNELLYQLNEADSLALFLLYEMGKDLHSKWQPYLKSLPVNVSSSPLFMTAEELEWLKLHNDEAYHEFKRFKVTVETRHREMMSSFKQEQELQWTLNDFKTAIAIVQSRIFGVKIKSQNTWHKTSCLVPFADLFNTATHTNSDCTYAYLFNQRSLQYSNNTNSDCATNSESTHFECFTTKDVSAGEQLLLPYTNSFNDSANLHLWLFYGFTLDTTQGDLHLWLFYGFTLDATQEGKNDGKLSLHQLRMALDAKRVSE